MTPRLAILETSQPIGWVALARGNSLLAARRLEEARRHARDLVPVLGELLAAQGWKAGDLEGVVVSRGPGSYTGLRVGIMSAKTLAYAIGRPLLAIDTFASLAYQCPTHAARVQVLADAQQDKVYHQLFQQQDGVWQAQASLAISPFETFKASVTPADLFTGPGLEIFAGRLPPAQLVPHESWLPRPESLLRLGLERMSRGERDDPFAVEPLYLRPSAAEEKFL